MTPNICFLCEFDSGTTTTEIKLPEDVAFKEALFTTSCAVMKQCLNEEQNISQMKRAEFLSMVQIVRERIKVAEIKSKVMNLLVELCFIQAYKPKLLALRPQNDGFPIPSGDLSIQTEDLPIPNEDLPIPCDDVQDVKTDLSMIPSDLPVFPVDLPVKEVDNFFDFSGLDDGFQDHIIEDNVDSLFDLEEEEDNSELDNVEALASNELTSQVDVKDEMEIQDISPIKEVSTVQVNLSSSDKVLLKRYGLNRNCIVKLEQCATNKTPLKKPRGIIRKKGPKKYKKTPNPHNRRPPSFRKERKKVQYFYFSDGESDNTKTASEAIDQDGVNSLERPIRSSRKQKQSPSFSYAVQEEDKTLTGLIPKNRKQRKQSPTFSPTDSASNNSSEDEQDAKEEKEDELPDPRKEERGIFGARWVFNSVQEEKVYLATGKWSRCEECKLLVKNMALVRHYKFEHGTDYRWKCKECPETFHSMAHLRVHKITHVGLEACDLCGNHFKQLKEHMKTCNISVFTKRRVWKQKCKDCLDEFTCPDTFYSHMSTMHQSPAQCPIQNCTAQLSSTEEERNHLRANHHKASLGEVVYDCSLCEAKSIESVGMIYYHRFTDHGKQIPCLAKNCTKKGKEELSFSTLETYYEHQREKHWTGNHKPVTTFEFHKCHLCEFVTCNMVLLKKHKRNVHGILDAAMCFKCGKEFNQVGLHMETCNGTGTRSRNFRTETYKCDICPDVHSLTEPLLALHSLEVHGIPYYKCKDCPERFTQVYLKNKHISEFHPIPSNEVLICPHCGGEFSSKQYYRQHCRTCDSVPKSRKPKNVGYSVRLCERFPDAFLENPDDPLKCSAEGCSYHAWRKKGIMTHFMLMHAMVTCDKCGELQRAKNIDQHYSKIHQIKTAENDLYPCDQCDLSFCRESHLQNHRDKEHIKEAKYGCNICSKMFISRKKLGAHKYVYHKEYSCKPCGFVSKKIAEYKQHMLEIHGETKLKRFKGGIE